jgi:DnaJ-class molecular chaperone
MDPYNVLHLDHDADNATIRAAYLALALKYHPDKNSQTIEDPMLVNFQEIAEAYALLSDSTRKREWDERFVISSKTSNAQQTLNVWDRIDMNEMDIGGSSLHYTCKCGDVFTLHPVASLPSEVILECPSCSLKLAVHT